MKRQAPYIPKRTWRAISWILAQHLARACYRLEPRLVMLPTTSTLPPSDGAGYVRYRNDLLAMCRAEQQLKGNDL